MVSKKLRKEKAAPFVARSREDDIKRTATAEAADENWKRQESLRKKEPEPATGALEEAFISYSPMSDIGKEASDNESVGEILPFEEAEGSAESSEDGISARISDGDVGKPAGNDIESNRSGLKSTDEMVVDDTTKSTTTARITGLSTSSLGTATGRAPWSIL